MISEVSKLEREEKTPQITSKVFKKRCGTTDKGKDYEHLYIANLILKLILNEEIEDFYLSSNDDNFGTFDDVVVEIKYKHKDATDFFALQLKHSNKKTTLGVEKLSATGGDFSIKKYYEDFNKNLRVLEHPAKLILFTNCMLDSNKTKELSFDEEKLRVVKHQQDKLMSTSEKEESCYVLEANDKNSASYEEFFHSFYLYTDQLDVERLKENTIEIFRKNFDSDASVFNDYLSFITQWSIMEGNKFKLDKKWMQSVVSVCTLSPFIKPLAFEDNKSVDGRGMIFREAVSKFDLTILAKDNYEKIRFLWLDIINDLDNLKEANNINNRYQVMHGRIETKESLYEKDLNSVNKLMWLLEKSPLVVEGCPQVYQLIKICQAKNLIVLDDRKNFNVKLETMGTKNNTGNFLVFQNVSDLKQCEQLYAKSLETFSYSLDGQKEAELKHLLEICEEIETLITTDDLADMLKTPWLVGNPKEELPPCHIERKVTKTVIRFEYLKHIPDNTVAVVSCVRDFNDFESILPNDMATRTAHVEKLQEPIDKKIYTCENYFPQEQFIAACEKNSETRFHHFSYLVDGGLEWIKSENFDPAGGEFTALETFRVQNDSSGYILDESEFFNNTERNINIICADPGMGKSTLMKSLKNNSSSLKWTVVIYARNHAQHFRSHRSGNIEKFVDYVLNFTRKRCRNVVHEMVFRRMMVENRIQIIWDGLDEASDATQGTILTLVKTFSKKGIKQWLTARNNLKYTLEVKLSSLSQSIKQFDDGEQREYIKNRLHISEQELFETFDKIKKNIVAFPNYGILGIPLQIYMLTELFSRDKKKYLGLLDEIFTVIDLYKYFVEEKFNILYQQKYNTDLSNEQNYQTFENKKKTKNYYKIIAANSYIYSSFMWNLFNKIRIKLPWSNKSIQKFLEKISSKGDDAGFITRVTSQNDVEFIHNSYGEYFAALYLFENAPEKARDTSFISDSRYNNILFFLDLMLSKDYKGFVAVIYNNPALLEDDKDVDLKQKDSIGRDILEVACLRNNEYPVVKKKEILEDDSFKREWVCYNPRKLKPLDYTRCHTFGKINEIVHMNLTKLLLFLPFLIPFFGQGEFSEEYSPAVLYYAIRFDFENIFECFKHSVSLKDAFKRINSRSILALALYSKSERILQKLLSQERYYRQWDCLDDLRISKYEIDEMLSRALQFPVGIDIESSRGEMLTHYVCENNLIKTLRLLILKNAKLDVPDRRGKLPMYYACHVHSDIVKVLVEVIGVQVVDESGRLPIHYACEVGNLDIVKLLLANGAKVDVPDRNGRLPIHYACENSRDGHDIVPFLIKQGATVNVPHGEGKLLIHNMCQNGMLHKVKLLLANGAKVDVPDRDGQLPIHYACENERYGNDIVRLLIKQGANVDVPDGEGKLPIHYACKLRSLDTVKLLLANGAKMDLPDRECPLPIHYACENISYAHNIVPFLIKQGTTVNVPDGEGNLPIHYACKRGYLDAVKLLLANGAKVDDLDRNG